MAAPPRGVFGVGSRSDWKPHAESFYSTFSAPPNFPRPTHHPPPLNRTMSRKKTSAELALAGRDRVQSDRFKARQVEERAAKRATPPAPSSTQTASVGKPPAWLDESARAEWREVVKVAPWLEKRDAHALAMYCRLHALYRSGIAGASAAHLREIRQYQTLLGLVPTKATLDARAAVASKPGKPDRTSKVDTFAAINPRNEFLKLIK